MLTTSSPALISTCGSIIKRESRLSGVDAFLRPDKDEEPLSTEDDSDPNLEPLVTEGERANGEATLETVLLILLLPLLSKDVEGTLFEVEIDNADLTGGFRVESCLLVSDFGDDRETLVEGEMGDDFFVSDTLTGIAALVPPEGNDARLLSPRGRLFCPEIVQVIRFSFNDISPSGRLTTEADCLSSTPPVLFLLFDEAAFELRDDRVGVCLTAFELESKTAAPSALFFDEATDPEAFAADETPDFTMFKLLLTLSAELTEDVLRSVEA